jgi:hypothetical protein
MIGDFTVVELISQVKEVEDDFGFRGTGLEDENKDEEVQEAKSFPS